MVKSLFYNNTRRRSANTSTRWEVKRAAVGDDETFDPNWPAECNEGPPVNMRGMKHAPEPIDWKSELTGDDD